MNIRAIHVQQSIRKTRLECEWKSRLLQNASCYVDNEPRDVN